MTQTSAKRRFYTRALGVLCIALVFSLGIAQAVHSHPDTDSQTSHHSCTICSAPTMGPAATTVDLLPHARPVAMTYSASETFVAFRPVVTNFVRPPPAV